MDPTVSIIIPCYQQARYLPAAVQSALDQSYPNVEVIVVNDGSTDATHDVALSFGHRIRYFEKPNGGLSSARNVGIAASRGEYLNFLDADDLLTRNCIAVLVQATRQRQDRVVLGGYRLFVNDPHEQKRKDFLPGASIQALPKLIHGNFGAVHSLLVSRSTIEEVGPFDEQLDACEDWDLWLRIALAGKEFVATRTIVAYYRRYEGSMSRDHQRMLRARTQVLLRAHDIMTARPNLLEEFGNELLLAEYRVLRRWLIHDKHNKKATELTRAIAAIRQQGFHTRSMPRRWLDRVMGVRSEMLALAFFKYARPKAYLHYADGWN